MAICCLACTGRLCLGGREDANEHEFSATSLPGGVEGRLSFPHQHISLLQNDWDVRQFSYRCVVILAVRMLNVLGHPILRAQGLFQADGVDIGLKRTPAYQLNALVYGKRDFCLYIRPLRHDGVEWYRLLYLVT